MIQGLRKNYRVVAAGAAVAAAMTFAPGIAHASGTSGTYNGCYAQWWNTAFAGYCYNSSGSYKQLFGNCNNETDYYGPDIWISGTSAPFDTDDCTWSVTSANVYQHG